MARTTLAPRYFWRARIGPLGPRKTTRVTESRKAPLTLTTAPGVARRGPTHWLTQTTSLTVGAPGEVTAPVEAPAVPAPAPTPAARAAVAIAVAAENRRALCVVRGP